MTVKLEAILSIEDSLANRLQKTWRKLSKKYKAEVTKALNANDPIAAQEVADSVDMTPVYTENVEFIRMQTYASLMHGATRLTARPRDTSVTTGAYAPAVEKVMAQFKAQIVGSVTAQVQKELVNLIAREFYEAPVEVQVKKYNPYHDPKTGRFTTGPGGLAMDQGARYARAKAMGFDTSTVYYHGTTNDVEAFDDSFLGTTTEHAQARMGHFFTPDVYLARQQSEVVGDFTYSRGGKTVIGANLIPVFLRGKLYDMPLDKFYEIKRDTAEATTTAIRTKLENEGYAGIKVTAPNEDSDVARWAMTAEVGTIAIFDPKNIRSIYAAFDPKDKDSRNILKYDPQQPRDDKGRWTDSRPATERMMDELWQISQGNPFDPRIRIMPVHPDHADDLVGVEARPFDGRVHLSSIITFSPKGKGAATRALRQLTDLADKYQVEIDGYVKPIAGAGDGDTPSLTKRQLHQWYAKFGFEQTGGDNILRKPKSALVAKYSQNQPRHPKGHPQGGQWSKTDQRMARAEAMGYDTKQIWYHGRQGDFEEFDPSRSKHAGAIYLTPNSNMAANFANYNWRWNDSQQGENIMPLVLPKNLRIFDYENPKDLLGLKQHLAEKTGKGFDEPQNMQASNVTVIEGSINYFVDRVSNGAWPYLESDLAQGYIKSKYHGFYVTERGKVKNLAVYNPALIRSVWAEFEADQWRSTNILKFDSSQPRWPEGHPKGGQWKTTEAASANFVVDDLDAVGMTPNMYDYHRDPDYFRESKGLVTKIVWMSPDDYLQEGAEILAENSQGRATAEEILSQRRENTDSIDWLANTLKNGPRKVAMPYLDRRKKHRGQEGMHRSLAAKKLGLTAIPVMLIEDADVILQKYDSNQPRHPKGSPKGGQWSKAGPKLTGYAKLVRDRANALTWYHGSIRTVDIDNMDPNRPIYFSESARYASYYAAGEATGSPLSFNPGKDTPLPDLTEPEYEAMMDAKFKDLEAVRATVSDEERTWYYGTYEELKNKAKLVEDFRQDLTPGKGDWEEVLREVEAGRERAKEIEAKLAEIDAVRDDYHRAIWTKYGRPKIYPVKVEINNPYLTTSEDWIYQLADGVDDARKDSSIQELLDQGYDSVAWTVAASEGDMDGFDEFGTLQGYAYASELLIIAPEAIKRIRSVYRKRDGTQHLSVSDIFVRKYNPTQPRYPKGHPQGGQWMKGGIPGALGEPQSIGVEGGSSIGWGAAFGAGAAAAQRDMQQWLKDNPGMVEPPTATAEQLRGLAAMEAAFTNEPEFQPHEPDGDALVRALGGNPEDILQSLVDRQAVFDDDPANRGIRVDATLEGEVYPMEEFTSMLEFFPDHSIEHFVLQQGRPYEVPKKPPQIDLMTPKECFSNAAQLTAMTFSDDGKYDYVEGYVIDRKLPFPIHHAWLEDKATGKVVDPTLGWRPTAAYYGVPMKRTYVRRKLLENGYYGIFTDGMRPNDIVLGKDEDFDYK